MLKTRFLNRLLQASRAAVLAVSPERMSNTSKLPLQGKGSWIQRMVLGMLVLGWFGFSVFAGTTYYAGPSGSSSNSGLSPSAPWPLSYACANIGANNTLIVLPGTYSGGGFAISYPNVTLKSQVKWGARLIGGQLGTGAWPAGSASGLVIDGFEIGSVSQMAITIAAGNHNCVVRNCWIHNTGLAGTESGSGIECAVSNGILIENNLFEYCGSDSIHNHCIYIAGTNSIVRYNVTRYGAASGIALGESATGYGMDNIRIYNNLSYGCGHWALVIGGADMHRIYVYNNTLVSPGYALGMGNSGAYTLYLTNNVLIGGTAVNNNWGTATAVGDYNIVSGYPGFSQAHSITSSSPGFVNPAKGLYWLTSASVARNAALSSAFAPTDFFGNAQSSVTDIGAFQYNSVYAADTRVLDPSPSGGANYWQYLGGGSNVPPPSTGGTSNAPGAFSFQASAGTITAPFFVTNGYVCQLVDTEPAGGGRAVYTFTTTNAGVYVVSAVVNVPNGSQNSFYVTMDDTAPNEPYNVWDMPTTSGFQTETVAWRGNGTWDADEFVPKAFALSAGTHKLVISGREPNTQLQSIQIQPVSLTAPSSAPVLRVVPGP